MSPLLSIVVPTAGRESLKSLMQALEPQCGQERVECFVVDDRPRSGRRGPRISIRQAANRAAPPPISVPRWARVLHSRGRGPAAARNVGWRTATSTWVVFMDDDVIPGAEWFDLLVADLESAPAKVAGIQGRVEVPLPSHRSPTDHERNVAGLASARWVTADMAYRRHVLEALGGFDERFTRAYREDADLAIRALDAGYELKVGGRTVIHPIPPARAWLSVSKQAGNRDDVLMGAKHGSNWRVQAGAPRGRRPLHLATVGAALAAVLSAVTRRRGIRRLAALVWAGLWGEFMVRRAAPGPRSARELGGLALTSLIIPFAATWHYLCALIDPEIKRQRRAVLFDRDGTLVADIPYNRDPELVVPMPSARRALDRLRAARIPMAVVSNQSGVARGRLRYDDVAAVNERVEELLGPLGEWFICTHGPDDACRCRKPAPGLILDAAARLGVKPAHCFVIGDIGSDVEAALAAGARPILVPTPKTLPEEIASAPVVVSDLDAAVDVVLEVSDA